MRLATITNWAYGVTVILTLGSGAAMLLASSAQEHERLAVAQRLILDQASDRLDEEAFALTDRARQYVVSGAPSDLIVYRREAAVGRSLDQRMAHLRDAGANPDELDAYAAAVRWAGTLEDEQATAAAARERGDAAGATRLLFGPEYERGLDRLRSLVEHFQYRLDQRTEAEMNAATGVARLWKSASEISLAVTALLFLCVLYFIFRQRILRPVVRLSDVVNRLAEQDYGVELPDIDQIDEIGDLAQAVRTFRENGIARQRLEEERAADGAMRDLLARMTQRMQGTESMRGLADVIERFVPEIAPEFAGRLYLLDAGRNAMVERCGWLGAVHSRAEFAPTACWALRRGAMHRPVGEMIDLPCEHLDTSDIAAVDPVCLPLTAQRETIGLLYLERHGGAGAEHRTPDAYLAMLAETIALAVANMRLRDELRDMAMADSLTGLANRRQLDTIVETHLSGADGERMPVSCLMIDVDHFKQFNDRLGHDAGDAVLRAVGGALRQASRDGGLAFRYGGEEFLLLIPGIGPDRAVERAEEIRRRIGELRVRHDGRELGPITVSVGVASAPEHSPIDKLIQTADAALLRAKQQGRDRVTTASVRGVQAA